MFEINPLSAFTQPPWNYTTKLEKKLKSETSASTTKSLIKIQNIQTV